MPRPMKCRRVEFFPDVTLFKPAGVPLRMLEDVHLTVEEVEAIRLKDLSGLEQEPAAEKMKISRQTFQRILASARRKVADALLNGKAIAIGGGNFEITSLRYRCHNGHEWELPVDEVRRQAPVFCPTCRTEDVVPWRPEGIIRAERNIGEMAGNRAAKAMLSSTGKDEA